jgi:competence protein ComEC
MSIFQKFSWKTLAIVFVVVILVWVFVSIEGRGNKFLEIDFYDVGQGDAIFIETPNGKQILVDGGPDLTILEKLGRELPFWDRYIDLVILTHPEYDHIGGLIEIIKRYKIGGILTTGVVRNTAEYKEWKRVIKEANIPIYIAQAGGVINLGDDMELLILHPFENLAGQEIKKSNNVSIVAQLVYKDFELLLTGDIEKKVERALVNSGVNLESDILKVPHHGSKTSSTKNFIQAVNPIVAIIQAGKDNSYGHPHQSVLDTLSEITTFCTGQDGDIEILSDGVRFHTDTIAKIQSSMIY